MSFLTPLYLLGALTIVLPILFHLIQRRPKGQQPFSSLMFLQASPPRITRRSRVTNWLLLALRATAILLLTLAFTRPFLRYFDQLPQIVPQRRIAILLDRSASMRQNQAWDSASQQVSSFLEQASEADDIGLFTYDAKLDVLVDFQPSDGSRAGDRNQLIRDALADLHPSWSTTNLGQALTAVAERLAVAESEAPTDSATIVLITDLQETSDLTGLQGFRWPENVGLDLRTVASQTGNASLQQLPRMATDDPQMLRVRVYNETSSKTTRLQLSWSAEGASDTGSMAPPVPVQVPAGRSRTLSLSRPSVSAQLVLTGDGQSFDNVLYVANAPKKEHKLMFVGDTSGQKNSLFFFLELAELSTEQSHIQAHCRPVTDVATSVSPEQTPLVIFGQLPSTAWLSPLKDYLKQGGHVLFVLDPTALLPDRYSHGEPVASIGHSAATELPAPVLAELLQLKTLTLVPREPEDSAFLTALDYRSNLFAPFAEPGYSDFSKIRVWRYVRMMTDHEQPWSILARFDDNSPAIVHRSFGKGNCWILASGWIPDTSQLALSSKFVPLLVTMIGRVAESNASETQTSVGSPIDLTGQRVSEIVCPDGNVVTIDEPTERFTQTDQIGFYQLVTQPRGVPILKAVNIDPSESRLVQMDTAQLEQLSVPLTEIGSAVDLQRQRRQLRDYELESQQRIWRWLVVAALIVLAAETYLAGRRSRRALATDRTVAES